MPDTFFPPTAAPWRRGPVGWVLAGLAFDLTVWGLIRFAAGRSGLLPSGDAFPGWFIACVVLLAVLMCWGHMSVLPAAMGRRRGGLARLALHLPAAAVSVAVGFIAGILAGFLLMSAAVLVVAPFAASTHVLLSSTPSLGSGPVWRTLMICAYVVVVFAPPVFLGGAVAARVMNLAVEDTTFRGWPYAVVSGWAALGLAPLPWLPDAVAGLAPLLVAVAALPWLLLTMHPPGAAGHTNGGVG